MKSLIITCMSTVFMLLTTFGTQAQNVIPSKKYITKDLNNIGQFHSINVLGSSDVEYRQSNNAQTTVSIYGSDNLVDLVEVASVNGVLQVRIKKGVRIYSGERRLKVIVSSPSLKQVDIIGSGDVYLLGAIKGNQLNLNISGSGDITTETLQYTNLSALVKGNGDIQIKNAKATSVKATISGSGDIEIEGSASQAKLTVNGSGDIEAEDLVAQHVIASVNGSGDITCHASQKLDASVSGSGEIEYEGDPKMVNKQGRKGSISEK